MYGKRRTELEATLAKAERESTERVDALNDLGWFIWGTDIDSSRAMITEASELAGRLGYERGQMFATRAEALLAYGRGDVEVAIKQLKQAERWFREHDDKRGLADVSVGSAYIYWAFGDFKRGFDYAHEALRLYEALDLPDGSGWAHSALGGFYHDWKDHQQSLEHYEEAHQIFVELENLTGQARALNGIGNAHLLLGEEGQALEFQEASLLLHEESSNEFGVAKTLNDIGLVLQRMDRYDEALEYHRKALAIREKHDYMQGKCTCLLDIGHVHIVQRNYDEAITTLNHALVAAEKVQSKPKVLRAHELLSQLYRDLGQFDVSLVHFENYHRVTEEVFNEDFEEKLRNLRSAHEIEDAEKESEIQRLKNVELKDKNEQLERTLRELNTTQAQLLQDGKMAALGNLVAGLAHEINNPVGAIKSAADVNRRALARIAESLLASDLDTGARKDLQNVLDLLRTNAENTSIGAERIERIVRSLRNFSRLDEAPFQRADIHEGIDSALTLIGPEITEGVEVVKEYGEVPAVYIYPSELNQVFMNLLLNALQAMGESGTVNIRTWHHDNRVNVEIRDTGKGIPPEKLDRLFEPGFTTRQATVRMRTGLYTSYNIVRNHLGELTVDSEVGKGSAFVISIPDRLDALLGGAARQA